jgi:hypothetical protein
MLAQSFYGAPDGILESIRYLRKILINGNSETGEQHRRQRLADKEPSRTQAGFMRGRQDVRPFVYRIPEVSFR